MVDWHENKECGSGRHWQFWDINGEKRNMSRENITAFTLTVGKGNVPNYIIQTIISQWRFNIHFHRERPEAKKEMSIKCQIC